MLGLNCLVNDTRAVQDIKDVIEQLVGERIDDGKGISFPAVYNELRKLGLEVDAESAGFIYNELYQGYNDEALSTEDEIMAYVGKDIADQQDAIVDQVQGGTKKVKQKQIGKLPPEKQVANLLASFFEQAVFGTPKATSTVMRQMQDLVAKAAKTLLPESKKGKGKSFLQNLEDFFDLESNEFQRLSGGVNNLETLLKATQDQVSAYLDQATDKLSDEDAEALRERWKKYTNAFTQAAYDLMLGKSDQNKLLNEALKQIKVQGKNIVDINDNVNWDALIDENNPRTISDSVKKLFQDGIKDADGTVHQFPAAQAERIGDYFQKLYEKKRASVILQRQGNQRAKYRSAKNIVSDFIKDRGFINLVKDKNGDLLLSQANWDAALRHMKKRVGDRAGLDVAVEQLRNFLDNATHKGKPFTESQKQIIEQAFRDEVAAKQLPATASHHDIQKLIALHDINGGKAFEQSTQYALNKVLGVDNLDQNTINQVKQLAAVAKSIVTQNNVQGSSSTNPGVNRGAYAFQALSQIERRIKEIIRENKIDRSGAQRIVKYVGDVMNAASTSLLLNPGNFGENILTGFGSNLGESVLMGLTNPKLYSKFGGDFWTAFASHVSGGVANEVIADQDMTADVQTGERLRFRGIAREFNKGFGGIASAIVKSPVYATSIVARTIMNSFDAGFNSAILRKKTTLSMYKALRSQGMSADDAIKAMSTALNVDPATEAQIDAENESIMAALKSVGLKPTVFDKMQNKRDMMLSLFEDAIGGTAAGVKMTPRQISQATKAIIESSQDQARVLTGKKQIPINGKDWLNTMIYGTASGLLRPQQAQFREQQEREQSGQLGSAARAQLYAELWKNTIARFAGGIANFLALATTVTPYGFVTASSLRGQKKQLLQKSPDAADITKADPGDIRKYAQFHNLARSITLRAAMGTLAIGGFITAKLLRGDDDEDESFIANLMQTKSGRRLLQKYLPLGINAAAAAMYDVNDPNFDTMMERLMDVAGNVTGTTFNKWEALKGAMRKAKTAEGRQEAIASALGSTVPTFNLNQGEQITKFGRVLRSAVDKEYINEVQEDEEISKAIYKEAEGFLETLLVNGSIDVFRRIADEERKYNRFKRED